MREETKSRPEAATALGVGGFQNLETTATGVSATHTGNIERWDQYLQSFVNEAIRAAVSGVNALGDRADSATGKFLALARAASRVHVGSSVSGGERRR